MTFEDENNIDTPLLTSKMLEQQEVLWQNSCSAHQHKAINHASGLRLYSVYWTCNAHFHHASRILSHSAHALCNNSVVYKWFTVIKSRYMSENFCGFLMGLLYFQTPISGIHHLCNALCHAKIAPHPVHFKAPADIFLYTLPSTLTFKFVCLCLCQIWLGMVELGH